MLYGANLSNSTIFPSIISFRGMNFSTTHQTYLQQIGLVGAQLQYPTYVVGGYVRDHLLGRACKDIDIVCVGNGIELARRAARSIAGASAVTVFQNFGTAMFRVGDVEFEFVGARRESYRADSRKPIVEDGTLADDQLRRDFTINALAVSIQPTDFGSLLDSFGGIDDLHNRIIRTPTDPNITFSDDPLRMLRAIRFATQLGFTLHPATHAAITANAERLHIISAERIHTELNKIMLSAVPSVGFKLLLDTALLPLILPELAAMRGVAERNGVRHKDNFYHTLQVLDNIAPHTDNLWLRWAALLHDIAKPITKAFDTETNSWTFRGHEIVGTKIAKQIFRRLKLPLADELKFVQKMVALHQRPMMLTQESITDSAVRRILFEAGDDIESLMTLCEADITSKQEWRVKKYRDDYEHLKERMQIIEASDQLRNWQPPISGEIIMDTFGIAPSRQVGIIKDAIREAILEGTIANDYATAYQYMLDEAAKLGLHPITNVL